MNILLEKFKFQISLPTKSHRGEDLVLGEGGDFKCLENVGGKETKHLLKKIENTVRYGDKQLLGEIENPVSYSKV